MACSRESGVVRDTIGMVAAVDVTVPHDRKATSSRDTCGRVGATCSEGLVRAV